MGDVLDSCLGVLVTAVIMTCFELVFMFVGTSSRLSGDICTALQAVNAVGGRVKQYSDNGIEQVSAFLSALASTEKERQQQINRYVKLVGSLLIVILSLVTTGIAQQATPSSIPTSFLLALMTVSMLIPFQIVFFLFSKKYQYERDDVLLRKVRNSLRECTQMPVAGAT